MVRFHALGSVTITEQDRELAVGGPRQRRLLAMLLIHRNAVVSVDRLADVVFEGEPTPAASTTLRSYVARVRRVINGAEGIGVVTQAPGYQLQLPDDAFDVARFEAMVGGGTGARVPRRCHRCRLRAARGARPLARRRLRRVRRRGVGATGGAAARGAAARDAGGALRRRAGLRPGGRPRARDRGPRAPAPAARGGVVPAHARPVPRRPAGGRAPCVPGPSQRDGGGARPRSGAVAAAARGTHPRPRPRAAPARAGRARRCAATGSASGWARGTTAPSPWRSSRGSPGDRHPGRPPRGGGRPALRADLRVDRPPGGGAPPRGHRADRRLLARAGRRLPGDATPPGRVARRSPRPRPAGSRRAGRAHAPGRVGAGGCRAMPGSSTGACARAACCTTTTGCRTCRDFALAPAELVSRRGCARRWRRWCGRRPIAPTFGRSRPPRRLRFR